MEIAFAGEWVATIRTESGRPLPFEQARLSAYRSPVDHILLRLLPAALVWTIFLATGRLGHKGGVLFCLGITVIKLGFALDALIEHHRGQLNSRRVQRREWMIMVFDMLMVPPFFYFFPLPEMVPVLCIQALVYAVLNTFFVRQAALTVIVFAFPFIGYPIAFFLHGSLLPMLIGHALVVLIQVWLLRLQFSFQTLELREQHHRLILGMVRHNVRNQLQQLGHVEAAIGEGDREKAFRGLAQTSQAVLSEMNLMQAGRRPIDLGPTVAALARPYPISGDVRIPEGIRVTVDNYFFSFMVTNLCENAMEAYARRRKSPARLEIWYDGELHVKDWAGGLAAPPASGRSEKENGDGSHGHALFLMLQTAHLYRMGIDYAVDRQEGSTEFRIRLPRG